MISQTNDNKTTKKQLDNKADKPRRYKRKNKTNKSIDTKTLNATVGDALNKKRIHKADITIDMDKIHEQSTKTNKFNPDALSVSYTNKDGEVIQLKSQLVGPGVKVQCPDKEIVTQADFESASPRFATLISVMLGIGAILFAYAYFFAN